MHENTTESGGRTQSGGAAKPQKRVISADEGADRIARRLRDARNRKSVRAQREAPFRCEGCGAREFIVVRLVQGLRWREELLECACDGVPAETTAATRDVKESWEYWQEARLSADHCVEFDEGGRGWEFLGEEEVELVATGDRGACVDSAADEDWRVINESEIEEDEDEKQEFWVRCGACDREIEFGFGGPRRELILPCESDDFNPRECVPDRKYEDTWRRRGWRT